MENMIVYEEREIVPKGAAKGIKPTLENLKKYLFDDEYEQIKKLLPILPFSMSNANLLYPGCGVDILSPLLYIERLFPSLTKVYFTFVDVDDTQAMIETVLDDVGIPFSRQDNKITLYWNQTQVSVKFVRGSIFEMIPSLPLFDIYFEKAFRIMKDDHKEYEQQVVDKLNLGGILISDSGFTNTSLKKIDVPKKLSKYGEMVVGRKESRL